MNDILKTALEFQSRNVSVIPVGKNKIPLIVWKEYQNRIATKEEIKQWWITYPDAQLGIITGKISGMTVVDVEKNGDYSKLPDTAIISTGGGGRHYYYRYHEGYKNKARIAPLTDIRGDGGYVMAPPSISDKGKYEIIKRSVLTIFPHWLFKSDKPIEKTRGIGLPEYNGTGTGNRNQSLTSYLGSLLNIIHPADWQTLAWAELLKANQKNNPPLSEYEIKTIFTSITNTEKRNPLKSHYKISLPITDDIDIVPIVEATERQGEQTTPYPLGFNIFDDALDGGVREGNLVVITGISGRGKTTLAQNITVNLGKQALPALWFTYEVVIDDLYNRFKNIYEFDLPIYAPKKIVSGNIAWLTDKISKGLKKYDTKFVFIDHIDFLQPKIFTNLDQHRIILKRICEELKTLAIEKKIIIFLIAHVKKVQGREVEMQDVAESSGIYQLCDLLISVDRKVEKINDNGMTVEVMTDTGIAKILKNRKTGKHPFFIFTIINGKIKLSGQY